MGTGESDAVAAAPPDAAALGADAAATARGAPAPPAAGAPPGGAAAMDPDHPLLQRAQRALKQQLEARRLELAAELKARQNVLKVGRRGAGGAPLRRPPRR
jgi:hypothetical protein